MPGFSCVLSPALWVSRGERRGSEQFVKAHLHAVGMARAGAEEQALVDPGQRTAGRLHAGRAAEIDVRGVHRLAARQLCHERRVAARSEEHTSELQSPCNLVCRLLLEKK